MPVFLCPCCGESYVVPLAFAELTLEERHRQGRDGAVAPARCPACQKALGRGDPVVIRKGAGVSPEGERQDLPAGSKAIVVDVATWDGEGSIFRVRLPEGNEVYVARAQLAPA
jgi:hypothetical protein